MPAIAGAALLRCDVRRFRPVAARDGHRRSQRRPRGQAHGARPSTAGSPPMSGACRRRCGRWRRRWRATCSAPWRRGAADRRDGRLCPRRARRRSLAQPAAELLAGRVQFGTRLCASDGPPMSSQPAPGILPARCRWRGSAPSRFRQEIAATAAERRAAGAALRSAGARPADAPTVELVRQGDARRSCSTRRSRLRSSRTASSPSSRLPAPLPERSRCSTAAGAAAARDRRSTPRTSRLRAARRRRDRYRRGGGPGTLAGCCRRSRAPRRRPSMPRCRRPRRPGRLPRSRLVDAPARAGG